MLSEVLFWVFLLVTFVSGQVHVYVDAGTRECFTRDLSTESVLLGSYKIEILDEHGAYSVPRDKANTGVVVDVEEVFASNNRVIHQRGSPSGKFLFSPLELGTHRICLTAKLFYKRKWKGDDPTELEESKFKRARVTLDFFIGDAKNILAKDNREIEELTSRIASLIDKITYIKQEQGFIRAKEATFRDLLEKACERVVSWLILQIAIVGVTFLYQLWTLLRFHMKRKVHID